jgi:hypothetical protein
MKTTAIIARPPLIPALSLALLLGVASGAHAERIQRTSYSADDAHMTADGNLVDVQVRVDGRAAPLFFRPGRWDRHYFQAFKGRNYSLVVRNNTGRRVGVLLAVDGLNVVNGEMSRLSHDEPMYVLAPNEQAVIRGWRTSLDEVRRFVFVDEERSYAERTGQSNGDLGWIRVLAFREVQQISWWDRLGQYRDRSNFRDDGAKGAPEGRESAKAPKPGPTDEAAPAPEAKRELGDNRTESRLEGEGLTKAQESNPGTGWGDRRHDPVHRTEFRAESDPGDQIVLRYEYASGLRALGIYPRRVRVWDREDGRLGFAQPPRW